MTTVAAASARHRNQRAYSTSAASPPPNPERNTAGLPHCRYSDKESLTTNPGIAVRSASDEHPDAKRITWVSPGGLRQVKHGSAPRTTKQASQPIGSLGQEITAERTATRSRKPKDAAANSKKPLHHRV